MQNFPDLREIRKYCKEQMSMLPERFKRINGNEEYLVKYSSKLERLKNDLLKALQLTK